MLQENDLLVDGCGVLEEVVLRDELRGGCVLALSLTSLDVVEVEQVGVGDQFSGIIEQDAIRSVSKLVAKTVFR